MENSFYYNASLVNISKAEKDFLKSKTCMLGLSIGQPAHEGEKFRATLNMINAYFKKCTIAVGDTLQRHTLAFSNSKNNETELYDLSYQLGSEWLERNEQMIKEELQIPHKIIRWNHWFKTTRFERDLEKVKKLYADNEQYRFVIHQIIDQFLGKYKKHIHTLCLEKGFKNSLEYLLEECACMLQWFDEECDYDIYPSIRNEAISATFKLLEPNKNSFLLFPAGIKFKKYIGQKQPIDLNKLVLDTIVKNFPGAIYWKNMQGVFAGCNLLQAQNLGFKKIKSLLGKTEFDFYDKDKATEIRKNELQVMDSSKTQVTEENIIIKGNRYTYTNYKTPIKDLNDRIIGLLGFSIDTTQQKKLNMHRKHLIMQQNIVT